MKLINICKKTLIAFISTIMCLIVFGYYYVPDVINTMDGDTIEFSGIYTVNINKISSINSDLYDKDLESDVKLFNKIPVKTANTIISKRKYVVPSGQIIGLRMFSKGVMIISTDSVITSSGKYCPSKKAGIKAGDLVISVNGKEIKTVNELSGFIASGEGKALELVYVRNGNEYKTTFTPVLSTDGTYRAGWWIRDSAAGIGTMTYYEKDTGYYGGLGHGICDADTDILLSLYYGDIVAAEINGCYKGEKGKAGELCGSLLHEKIGTIYKNCNNGVYGVLNKSDENQKAVPVALKSEVHNGPATILCTIDSDGVKEYSVEIEKINLKEDVSKNLIIRITDESLLSVTGGIVQGMSGSPILQDGKIVGAVTHVLVNDPTKGYGIFIENMLESGK